MENIIRQLKSKADDAPDDVLLRRTISTLQDIQRNPDGPQTVSWDTLHRDFALLQDRGLWERSTENDEILDALHLFLTSQSLENSAQSAMQEPSEPPPERSPGTGDDKVSIVVPPAQNVASQLISNPLVLPVELIDILNNAYFLHILATNPTQVLPPGKSLLSVMSRSHATSDGDAKSTLRSRVEDLVHKAFWDEAVGTLSNPEPSVQLPRIKLLYSDLHTALSQLFPPSHPVLVTLSSPLSPTPSPLDSTVMSLREVMAGLRERCAPVRDPEIDALQRPLGDPPARSSPPVALAILIVDTVRSILKLSEIMKDDLSQFVFGSMTEQQLKSVITKQAKTTEREIVIDVWRRDRMRQAWTTWLHAPPSQTHLNSISAEPHFLWIVRIVQALGAPLPVSSPLPTRTVQISSASTSEADEDETPDPGTPHANAIPPIFFFSAPTLLKIQNYLQALVIAASLRTLTRLPIPTRPAASESPDPDSFMFRVWTLLRAEIAGEPESSDTKLVNLADEVVRARIQAMQVVPTPATNLSPMTPIPSSLTKEDEAQLRAAVDRTLKPGDPVYKLLQTRLLTALVSALVKRRQADAGGGGAELPATLRTGRDGQRAEKRPRLVLDLEDLDDVRSPPSHLPRMTADAKGFEDPVLNRAAIEVFDQVDRCLEWVESVWGDVIEAGDVDSPPPRQNHTPGRTDNL